MKIAAALGARTSVSNDVFLMDFSSYTLAVNSKTSVRGIRQNNGSKKRNDWKYSYLSRPVFMFGDSLMAQVEALPEIFNRSFSYHLQKRILSVNEQAAPERRKGFRSVQVRFAFDQQKVWISVQDLAKALGVVQYNSQVDRYKLVLPDFTILELRAGQNRVFRREETYKILEDPILLFSGLPYMTLTSIKPIFGVDAQWDAKTKTLQVSSAYERSVVETGPKVKYLGYQPQPLSYEVEEWSMFYQDPAPSYPAQNTEVYESVRDFLTNDVIRRETNTLGKISGEALPSVRATFLGAPFEARGLFQKVGPDAELANGGARWGFPKLQISGGREYITVGGFSNQFNQADMGAISHSNDYYGENDANPSYKVRAFHGQTFFSIFMSSSLFSQTADFRQKFTGAELDGAWSPADGHQLTLGVEQYVFENKREEISSQLHEQDFLADLFGDEYDLSVSRQDQNALVDHYLSDRHYTTVADVGYRAERLGQVSGVVASSYYSDPSQANEGAFDTSWKLRAMAGAQASRLDASYERTGPRYRSIGSPLRYQDRDILRLAPYLDLARFWKIYGEFRREDSKLLTSPSKTSMTNTFMSAYNLFTFASNSVRATFSRFDSTLFGDRFTAGMNFVQYLGRDTFDIGGLWGEQRSGNRSLFRQSYTGKASYQILNPDWRLSLAEELTQNHYPLYRKLRWESISSLYARVKSAQALFQYEMKPKYFLDDAVLHTGTVRVGHRVRDNKSLNAFAALTSRQPGLGNPDVWRIGIEYAQDFY